MSHLILNFNLRVRKSISQIIIQGQAPTISMDSIFRFPITRLELPDVHENDILSMPKISLFSVETHLQGLPYMTELEYIEQVTPDENIPMMKNNFMKKRMEGFKTDKELRTKSKRGRKSKPKKNNRKTQGTGECFNSQTEHTIVISDELLNIYKNDDLENSDVNTKVKNIVLSKVGQPPILKPKLFRKNKLQVPNIRLLSMDDAYKSIEILCKFLMKNFPDKEIYTETPFEIVMINYNFHIKRQPNEIIDLQKVTNILRAGEIGEGKFVHSVGYNLDKGGRLRINITDPKKLTKKKKTTTIVIFAKGAINIQGAKYNNAFIKEIYEFLHDLITNNKDDIMVKLLLPDALTESEESEDETEESDDEEDDVTKSSANVTELTEEDYEYLNEIL